MKVKNNEIEQFIRKAKTAEERLYTFQEALKELVGRFEDASNLPPKQISNILRGTINFWKSIVKKFPVYENEEEIHYINVDLLGTALVSICGVGIISHFSKLGLTWDDELLDVCGEIFYPEDCNVGYKKDEILQKNYKRFA